MMHKTWVLSLFNSILILIHLTVEYAGNTDVADVLVKAKANLNIENIDGDTPLKLAKTSGSLNF